MTPDEKQQYDEQKNRLHMKVISRNLSESSRAGNQKLVDGLKNVPVKAMLDQLQYLENVLLPKIEANRGRDSQDYTFYAGVADTIQWAVLILDRYDKLSLQYHRDKLFTEHLVEKLTFANRELQKYEAAEDLLISESMQTYLRAAAQRIQNLKENNK